MSRKLAEFVAKELHKANSPSSLDVEPKGELPEIYKISITSGVPKDRACWTKQGAFWMKPNFIADLQKCIDKKNEKYEEYMLNCNECWLLMVADKWNPAQAFDIDFSNEAIVHVYQSKFRKTFYLEVTEKCLVELKTTWP